MKLPSSSDSHAATLVLDILWLCWSALFAWKLHVHYPVIASNGSPSNSLLPAQCPVTPQIPHARGPQGFWELCMRSQQPDMLHGHHSSQVLSCRCKVPGLDPAATAGATGHWAHISTGRRAQVSTGPPKKTGKCKGGGESDEVGCSSAKGSCVGSITLRHKIPHNGMSRKTGTRTLYF